MTAIGLILLFYLKVLHKFWLLLICVSWLSSYINLRKTHTREGKVVGACVNLPIKNIKKKRKKKEEANQNQMHSTIL